MCIWCSMLCNNITVLFDIVWSCAETCRSTTSYTWLKYLNKKWHHRIWLWNQTGNALGASTGFAWPSAATKRPDNNPSTCWWKISCPTCDNFSFRSFQVHFTSCDGVFYWHLSPSFPGTPETQVTAMCQVCLARQQPSFYQNKYIDCWSCSRLFSPESRTEPWSGPFRDSEHSAAQAELASCNGVLFRLVCNGVHCMCKRT